MVDEAHWAGLPTQALNLPSEVIAPVREEQIMASRSRNASVLVHHRDLTLYDRVGAA